MKTINLIPDNYKGNPRNALGYSWSNLVMNGCTVDHEQSIPGDDLKIGLDECLDRLIAEFGEIAVRDMDNYGWLKSDAKTKDGDHLEIDSMEQVATINCMWCGGGTWAVYRVNATAKKSVKPVKKEEKFVRNPAYAHLTPEQIKASEIAYDNLQNEGHSEGNFNPYRDHLYIQAD